LAQSPGPENPQLLDRGQAEDVGGVVEEVGGVDVEDPDEAAAELVQRLGVVAAAEPALLLRAAGEGFCQRPNPVLPAGAGQLFGAEAQLLLRGVALLQAGPAALHADELGPVLVAV